MTDKLKHPHWPRTIEPQNIRNDSNKDLNRRRQSESKGLCGFLKSKIYTKYGVIICILLFLSLIYYYS